MLIGLAPSSSRKSGWAMEMTAAARSASDFLLRLTMAYSVTTDLTSERGVITTLPGASLRT